MPSSPKISVPGPSKEETALQKEQVELLRQQRDVLSKQLAQQNLLAPILFERAGLKPTMDKNGEIVGFETIEDPFEERSKDIQSLLLDRTEAALRGELPENPALLRDLSEQEDVLRDRLFRQLGPGFETSTPGIEALAEFGKRAEELREGARRGDLTLAEQLSLSRQGAQEQSLAQVLARISGTSGFQFGNAEGLSRLAGAFQAGPIASMQSDRSMETQALIANAQARASETSALFGGLGMIGGMALGSSGKPWWLK